jgi:hypothetical protein
MTSATIAALVVVSLGNALLVGLLWRKRLKRGRERPASFRSNIALSALLSITFSSATYVVFALLWLFQVRAAFTGQQTIALLAVRNGLATAAMALLGGWMFRAFVGEGGNHLGCVGIGSALVDGGHSLRVSSTLNYSRFAWLNGSTNGLLAIN